MPKGTGMRSPNSYGWYYPGGGWGDSNGPRNDPDYFKRKEEPKKEEAKPETQEVVNEKDSPESENASADIQDDGLRH